eukprot:7165910-Pyramimonas_sp.AAC.1
MAAEPPMPPSLFDYARFFLSPPVNSHVHRFWMGWWGYAKRQTAREDRGRSDEMEKCAPSPGPAFHPEFFFVSVLGPNGDPWRPNMAKHWPRVGGR